MGIRIKGHGEVKTLLANKLRKQNEVFVEPTMKVRGNLHKPHLVVKNEISYENKDYVLKADKEKIDKYLPCLTQLKFIYGLILGAILPVVLGS